MTETWIVVGASSAIARAFALSVARGGADVVLCGRDVDDLKADAANIGVRTGAKAEVVRFDAEAFATHDEFLRGVFDRPGAVSIFVAVGNMPGQIEMQKDPDLALSCVNANYVAMVSLLQRIATHMEARKAGSIVILGSVAGDRGRRSNYVYGSAKAGLHAFAQGLRARLFHAGVHVVTAKPGFIDTAMTWGLKGLFLVASPEACAEACIRALANKKDVIYFPWFWFPIMTIIRLLPETIAKRLSF